MQDMERSGEGIISTVLDRIRNSARVELVYGEGREIGDKTIIPVAAVAYGFGAGAGSSATPASGDGQSEQTGGGGGGGGGVRVQPVGVLEVTADDTRLVPIIDWTRVITTAITFFGIWMIFRTIFRRR
jgi:uncharacterized spore protein YtfJ